MKIPGLDDALGRLENTEQTMGEIVTLLRDTNELLREQNEILRGWNQRA